MKSPCHDEFSLWCAVGLLSISLETLIITGSVVKLEIAFVFSMQDASRLMFEAAFNVVILSALLFIVFSSGSSFAIGGAVYLDSQEVFFTCCSQVGDYFRLRRNVTFFRATKSGRATRRVILSREL
jgi:hypothetical protein